MDQGFCSNREAAHRECVKGWVSRLAESSIGPLLHLFRPPRFKYLIRISFEEGTLRRKSITKQAQHFYPSHLPRTSPQNPSVRTLEIRSSSFACISVSQSREIEIYVLLANDWVKTGVKTFQICFLMSTSDRNRFLSIVALSLEDQFFLFLVSLFFSLKSSPYF